MTEQIVSRIYANEHELKFYFTGKACKHGHVSQRYTSNDGCIECLNISVKVQQAKISKRRAEKREANYVAPETYEIFYFGEMLSREDAKAKGIKSYFTGEYCIHGHMERRLVSNGTCMQCDRIKVNKTHAADPEAHAERSRIYREKNADLLTEKRRLARTNKVFVHDTLVIIYSGEIIGREHARNQGCDRFFTGIPCSEGHIDQRYTKRGRCCTCIRSDKQWFTRVVYRERYLESYRRKHYKDPVTSATRAWVYRETNPELIAAHKRNRRAIKNNAEGTHTAIDVIVMYWSQIGRCANFMCNVELTDEYHIDHIVALVNGGSNWPSNLQLLCPKCNMSKGSKDYVEFLMTYSERFRR